MPNWVENHLRVSAKPELVSEIKEYIKGENGAIDFEKIIPCDREKFKSKVYRMEGEKNAYHTGTHSLIREEDIFERVTTDERNKDGEQLVGYAMDWYDAHLATWGTKWNACHIDLDTDEPGMFEIRFDTAWSDPEAVIDTLVAKFPEAKFEYYAMEEMGAFYMYGSSVDGVLERNYVEHEDIYNDEAKAAAVARTMREAGMDPDEYNIKNIVDKCDLYFDISDEHGFEGFKGVELELYEYDASKWARFKKRKPNGKK